MRPPDIKNGHVYALYCEGICVGNATQLNLAKLFAKSLAENQEKDVVIVHSYTGEIVYQFIVKRHIEIIEVEP